MNYQTKGFRLVRFAVATTVFVVAGFVYASAFQTQATPEPHPVLAAVGEVGVYEEWVPELPVRIVIPALGIDAPVQPVGLAPDGTGAMDVPSNFTDVGWYTAGVRPGMRGSAVMAGHYNGRGVPEAVFYDLDTLQIGDKVVVMSEERIEDIFVVVKIATYEYDAPTDEVFVSTDGKARLNLITCGGEWLPEVDLYRHRTVVFTEQLTNVE